MFGHLTFAAHDEDPGVDARLAVFVTRLVVLLVIVDGLGSHLSLLLLSCTLICLFVVPDRLVGVLGLDGEATDGVDFGHDLLNHLLLVSIVVVVLLLHQVVEDSREGAFHV